jgi:hypothetical protein
MAPKKVKTAHWYASVECPKCHNVIPLLEVPSPQEVPKLALPIPHQKSVDCPKCKEPVQVNPMTLRRRRAMTAH